MIVFLFTIFHNFIYLYTPLISWILLFWTSNENNDKIYNNYNSLYVWHLSPGWNALSASLIHCSVNVNKIEMLPSRVAPTKFIITRGCAVARRSDVVVHAPRLDHVPLHVGHEKVATAALEQENVCSS